MIVGTSPRLVCLRADGAVELRAYCLTETAATIMEVERVRSRPLVGLPSSAVIDYFIAGVHDLPVAHWGTNIAVRLEVRASDLAAEIRAGSLASLPSFDDLLKGVE